VSVHSLGTSYCCHRHAVHQSASSVSAGPSVTSVHYGTEWSLMSVPVVKQCLFRFFSTAYGWSELYRFFEQSWDLQRPSTYRLVAAGSRRRLCKWDRQEHFLVCSGWPLHSRSCKSHILGLVCVAELPPRWTRSVSSCASVVPNCVLWRTLNLRLN
jgi:hypothetical protein